jgi:hypothetical protein
MKTKSTKFALIIFVKEMLKDGIGVEWGVGEIIEVSSQNFLRDY